MHYVFTMETVWKLQICRISGCRYKSGKGFNGENVRVKATNRKQTRGQERGPEASYRGTQKNKFFGKWPPIEASQRPWGWYPWWYSICVCVCVCVYTCMCEWAEKDRDRKRERRRRKRRGRRGRGRHYFPLKIFLVFKTSSVSPIFVNIPVCPILSSSRNIGDCLFSELYLAFFFLRRPPLCPPT